IYALGCTMYFLLTGQEPLALQTASPIKVNPLISEHTSFIVERATAQDPWLRFQSAKEMQEEIDRRAETEVTQAKPPWRVVAVVAACLAFVCMLGFGWVQYFGTRDEKPETKGVELTQRERDLTKKLEKNEKQLALLQAYASQRDKSAAAHQDQD